METTVAIKDICQEFGWCERTVRNWIQRTGVKPTYPGHANHRWSLPDYKKFIRAIRAEMEKENKRAKKKASTSSRARSR